MLPEHIWNTGMLSWPGQDGGFLGRTADPWLIHCQPHKPGFQIGGLSLPADVSDDRLAGRLALLERVNKRRRSPASYDHKTRQALDLRRAAARAGRRSSCRASRRSCASATA